MTSKNKHVIKKKESKKKRITCDTEYNFTKNSCIIFKLYNDVKYKDILINLINKTTKYNNIKHDDIIKSITNSSDSKIINNLVKYCKNTFIPYNEADNMIRANYKWKGIKNNLPNIKINNILDFGGNVGDTAHVFGNILNLQKSNIFVVDIDEWSGVKWKPRSDITFINYNNIDKIPSNKIDIITIFHVLHHIKSGEFPKIIELFNRILTDTGVIVLYEHNLDAKIMSSIIDLEHLLYDTVTTQTMSYSKYIKDFYAKYYSIEHWEKLFSKYFSVYFKLKLNSLNNSFYLYMKRK